MLGPARKTIAATLVALLLGIGTGSSTAAEITILSGGAAKSGVMEIVPLFEAASGHRVKADFKPMGALTKDLAGGAAPDVVIVTEEVLADIGPKGLVQAATATEVGRVGIGVAVKTGAPEPAIGTPEQFKAALLAAKSIVMIDPVTGTSGRHLAKVFAELGVVDQIKDKTKYLQGGYVVEPVGRGEIELGLHQITEILPVPGVRLVGPLPAALQKVTVYTAALGRDATQAEAALQFLAMLKTPEVRRKLLAKGFMASGS